MSNESEKFLRATEAITEAVNKICKEYEKLLKAIRQSETQCDYIKPKHTRPVYRKGKKPCDGYRTTIRTREGFRK